MSQVARAFVEMLRKSEDVPEHVVAGILACHADAVPPLVELMGDRSVDRDGRLAREHAAELLGHLGERAAVAPLLDTLVTDRGRPSMVKACATALARIGEVSEATLTRAQATDVHAEKVVLAMVLASAGSRSEAITAFMGSLLEAEPDLMLPLVGRYGDRALAAPVGRILLAAADQPRRVSAAVDALRALGVDHPKLRTLGQKANDVDVIQIGQKMLDDLQPDLDILRS